MFASLTLRGVRGAVVLGYQNAATLSEWEIRRPQGKQAEWTLAARIVRVNNAHVRQRPLFFTAPRAGGFWCFPVVQVHDITATHLYARLGAPEH